MARIQRTEKRPTGARLPVRRELRQHALNILDFGAIADGTADCSQAINTAIAEATNSNSTVIIPAGKWRTGPIVLSSGAKLHFEDGAELLFIESTKAYLPAVRVQRDGLQCLSYSPLIYAHSASDISITGRGVLRCEGHDWHALKKHEPKAQRRLRELAEQNAPLNQRQFDSISAGFRPPVIGLYGCTNARVSDVSIVGEAPGAAIQISTSNNIELSDITINSASGDDQPGLLIDSSRGVVVARCSLETAGEGIIIESHVVGSSDDQACEKLTIRNVRVNSRNCAIFIRGDDGGVIRNVKIADCNSDGSHSGICFSASRGKGGTVEDITLKNIDLGKLHADGIRISTGADSSASRRGRGPDFKLITLENIACQQAKVAIHLEGLPDQFLENIELRNVIIASEQGLFCGLATGLQLKNVRIKPLIGPSLSIKDARKVIIDGMHQEMAHGIFLEVRGRQTREVVLRQASRQRHRPSVVVGIDVPKDAIVHA